MNVLLKITHKMLAWLSQYTLIMIFISNNFFLNRNNTLHQYHAIKQLMYGIVDSEGIFHWIKQKQITAINCNAQYIGSTVVDYHNAVQLNLLLHKLPP